MASFSDIGSLIYEHEADLAYQRQVQIDEAATWCKKNYPHKFEFLNDIYQLLVEEERQMARMGLSDSVRTGAVKLQPVLAVLTPSQALRLLEAFKRETTNGTKVWRSKRFYEMERDDADRRLDQTVAKIKEELQRKK